MYTLVLYTALVFAYSAWLYYRYHQLEAATKQAYSFSKVMGVRIYKAMVVALFAAIVISTMAARSLPVIVSTSQPAILVDLFNGKSGNGVFVWSGWSPNAGMVYQVHVGNSDGSFTPFSIPADQTVRIIEDETLEDTGTWTVTTSKKDMTAPTAGWTFNYSASTVIKNELRVPTGTAIILRQ